jgi:hypothetical protein
MLDSSLISRIEQFLSTQSFTSLSDSSASFTITEDQDSNDDSEIDTGTTKTVENETNWRGSDIPSKVDDLKTADSEISDRPIYYCMDTYSVPLSCSIIIKENSKEIPLSGRQPDFLAYLDEGMIIDYNNN